MKKIEKKLIAIVVIIISITLQSCNSKSDDVIENTGTDIEYKLDGTQIENSDISYFINNSISLIEIENANHTIRLWLPKELTVGTYEIVSGEAENYTANLIDKINGFTSENESGTIILSNVENRIEGTFSYTGALNNVFFSISEGKFSVSSLK